MAHRLWELSIILRPQGFRTLQLISVFQLIDSNYTVQLPNFSIGYMIYDISFSVCTIVTNIDLVHFQILSLDFSIHLFMSQYVYVSNWPFPFIGMSVWFLSPSYCIPIWKNYRRIKGIIRWQIELGIPALWSGRRWKNNKIGNAGNSKRNELKQLISNHRAKSKKFSFSIFEPPLAILGVNTPKPI